MQVESAAFAAGADPSANAAPTPANRFEEFAVADFNVENLYDFRDDPFDGCDFAGNTGCPGVNPPFDYVPAQRGGRTRSAWPPRPTQIRGPMHSPDILLIQEAEDQDICTVTGGALVCGDDRQRRRQAGHAAGAGADDRRAGRAGLRRRLRPRRRRRPRHRGGVHVPHRPGLAGRRPARACSRPTPGVDYRARRLAYNADVQNPKSLNAVCPSDVDTSTGVDGSNVYTRAPQVAKFLVAAAPGSPEQLTLWAVSNHFSSTPDARVGQRTEQAAYGAAIVDRHRGGDPHARIAYGGDLNVFPRPDDPIATSDADTPSDQLGAALRRRACTTCGTTWSRRPRRPPTPTSSRARPRRWTTSSSTRRSTATWCRCGPPTSTPAGRPTSPATAPRGVSDHDPQIARFRSRASLSVADVTVAEGDTGHHHAGHLHRDRVPAAVAGRSWSARRRSASPRRTRRTTTALAQCQTLAAGATSVTFTVTVKGDNRREPDERFVAARGRRPARPARRPDRLRHHHQRRLAPVQSHVDLGKAGELILVTGLCP